uniref:Uncharacterized protein n=1 Tax=Periophthalmus magnuspinnatus TaxID=409849 RepID=A0A3B4A6Z9_9GOBI
MDIEKQKEKLEEEDEEENDGLAWLLRIDSSDVAPSPMDTNITQCSTPISSDTLFLDTFIKRIALLVIAEKTGDLQKLVNAPYTDWCYKGQTALHVAIERRSLDHVKLLVEKGADVQAKANGKFFQQNEEFGFYFGELPLSLAACTNQPEVVSYLLDNPHRQADVTDRDSDGNTVLHALVVIADNSPENTDMIADMYDKILTEHHILHRDSPVRLEDIKNNQGLTPLKLAAKLGRIGLLKHMLHREFLDKESRPLSRKFTEWVYGPVHFSLYDTSSIDTDEDNSVLEIIVFGSKIPNRTEMLQLEPLCSLLKDKWERFASKLFLFNFLVYMVFLIIFTAVAINRKEGKVRHENVMTLDEEVSVQISVWPTAPVPHRGCS